MSRKRGRKPLSAEQVWERLVDAMAESVLQCSDEEILAEYRDEGLDPAVEAAKVKAALLNGVARYFDEHGGQ